MEMNWDEIRADRERLLNRQYMIVNMQLGTVVLDYESGEMKTFPSKAHAEAYIEYKGLNPIVYKAVAVQDGSR